MVLTKSEIYVINAQISVRRPTNIYYLRVMSPTSYQLLHPAMFIFKTQL